MNALFSFFDVHIVGYQRSAAKVESFRKQMAKEHRVTLSLLPEILNEYLQMELNTSVGDIFLMFLNRILEYDILEPDDLDSSTIFQILHKAISLSSQCRQFRLQHAATILIVLLRKGISLPEGDDIEV